MTTPDLSQLEMWQMTTKETKSSVYDFIKEGKEKQKDILFVIVDEDFTSFPLYFNGKERGLLRKVEMYNNIFYNISPPYLINEERWSTLDELREIY